MAIVMDIFRKSTPQIFYVEMGFYFRQLNDLNVTYFAINLCPNTVNTVR